MHGEINTGGFGNYPTGEWSVESTEWTAILGDLKKKNYAQRFQLFWNLKRARQRSFFKFNQPTRKCKGLCRSLQKQTEECVSVCVCVCVCAPATLPAASASAPSKVGRVCMAKPGRHGRCVAEGEEEKNVLPELERSARGDLRRQALRSGAVL